MAEVGEAYKTWLASDPLTRLTVDTPTRPNHSRLEGRVTASSCIPSSVTQLKDHRFEETDGRSHHARGVEAISTRRAHGKGRLAQSVDCAYYGNYSVNAGAIGMMSGAMPALEEPR